MSGEERGFFTEVPTFRSLNFPSLIRGPFLLNSGGVDFSPLDSEFRWRSLDDLGREVVLVSPDGLQSTKRGKVRSTPSRRNGFVLVLMVVGVSAGVILTYFN